MVIVNRIYFHAVTRRCYCQHRRKYFSNYNAIRAVLTLLRKIILFSILLPLFSKTPCVRVWIAPENVYTVRKLVFARCSCVKHIRINYDRNVFTVHCTPSTDAAYTFVSLDTLTLDLRRWQTIKTYKNIMTFQ